MKLILFFILLAANFAFADVPAPLIAYRFGNEVSFSELTIVNDGSMIHIEGQAFPPKIEYVEEKPLPAVELNQLVQWISDASSGSQIKRDGQPSSLVMSVGFLHAYNAPATINIRTIDFGNFKGAPQKVYVNEAGAARSIENLVFSHVRKPMPQ